MRWITQFGRFWYDFVVGDDWTIAVAVAVLIALTAAVAHTGTVAWPILPAGVTTVLGVSVWRVRRAQTSRVVRPGSGPDPEQSSPVP